MNAKFPVVILSYNRPHYLERVLGSMRTQSLEIGHSNIFLFQDGPAADADTKKNADLIAECVRLFSEYFPSGRVINSERNLGIAWNFERAERFVFETLQQDCGYFFEDDLVLGPEYLAALETLAFFMLARTEIASVAAHGDPTALASDQHRRRDDLVLMTHRWGFALSKHHWSERRKIIDGYLAVLGTGDYRRRDHEAIRKYFQSLGCGVQATSQDAAKDVAMVVLGLTKIMSYVPYGKYIGETGVHFTPSEFAKRGYADTQVWREKPAFRFPDAERLKELVQEAKSTAQQIPPQPKAEEKPTAQNAAPRTLEPSGQELSSAADRRLAEIRSIIAARNAGVVKIIIGAADTNYAGWVSTNELSLNLLKLSTWHPWLTAGSVDAILAEHVWEHLTFEEGYIAAITCMNFLKSGARLRIAVPDRFHPSESYRELCKIGNKDGNKTFHDYRTLSELLKTGGFRVDPLEYWDEQGVFHSREWSSDDGHIARSSKHDRRNLDGNPNYTSLIIDAYKIY